eukprot:TRINITY_DN2545_c0_g1_i7.p1 TRINITY_DN2545_c0_g1~~TRINITY_DN2545_c0_g1_i7.p1  ORF type:complete len:340 (-),score=15.21 TRINITY_DN2545_c0_g1_i7:76-1095(-)
MSIEIAENEITFEWEERDDSTPYLIHMIAGSFAGISEHCSMLPIDTIKTHMQVKKSNPGFINTLRSLQSNIGFLGLWKGASIQALGCVPAHAAYFSIYEHAKSIMNLNDGNQHFILFGLTGALATCIHDIIITPFDVLKQRQQLTRQKINFILKNMIKQEGLFSLFRSVPVTMMINLPSAATIVCVNESLKIMYKPQNGHSFWSYLACASFAGSAAACVTIPLDVIKTKLQTQSIQKNLVSMRSKDEVKQIKLEVVDKKSQLISSFARNYQSSQDMAQSSGIKYRNILQTIQSIYLEEGLRGFVKGVTPRMLQQAPSAAISWTVYEMIKNSLINRNNRE